MSRTAIDRQSRAIFGARFSEQFNKYKKEYEGITQEQFGKLLDPPARRGSVMKWLKGENIPNPYNLKQICELFGVPEDYFNTENATHDELYRYGSNFITEIGKENAETANEIGLNLELVRVLSKLVDFNKCFPVYAPIKQEYIYSGENAFNRKLVDDKYKRVDNAESAKIDDDLKFLQVYQDGRYKTFSKIDIIYLKEAQDQIADYVEYIFFKRSKEMEEEVIAFNRDTEIVNDNGEVRHKAVTKEFVIQHDRFAKYLDFPEEDKKEGQDNG